MEWDEAGGEGGEESSDWDPHFESESVARELVLVALEAAALTRRIFPPPRRGRDVSCEGRQAVLALSLVEPATGLMAWEVGHLLALDREQARDVLAELKAFGLISRADWEPPEDDDDAEDLADIAAGEVPYRLTRAGRRTADELAVAAKRFLPGWPPRER